MADRSALAPCPPLAAPLRCRTAIVGSGIAGLSLALALARRGDDSVVVLERFHGAAGATGRNAGFLLCDSECIDLAARMHGETAAFALHDAGLATRSFVRDLERGLDDSPPRSLVTWTGSVRLAADRGESCAFAATAARGLPGIRCEPLVAAPESGSVPYLAALADDGDGLLDPLALVALILALAEARGVRRFDATPVETLRATRTGVVLSTPGGDVTADRVIVCTNPDAARLLPRVGASASRNRWVPVRPVRAQALAAWIDPMPAWRRPTYATRGGDYWRPLPDGRVLLGGMRRVARRAENTAATAASADVQRALDAHLRHLVGPEARIDVTHRWGGTMAFTPDGVPRVGPVFDAGPGAAPGGGRDASTGPGRSRIHVLAGFNGHGMGWAPGLADVLAATLQSSDPSPRAGRSGSAARQATAPGLPKVFRPGEPPSANLDPPPPRA
ncbi:MAG: FAD-binding oxidoreductase [Planctomycetes bacterium]|nr:FAD-binding oxidoreductase [Planctomycetota bacterium]